MIRRLIDISVAIAGLTFGLPILILTSICVRLTMGSPVLFRQARAGLMGTSFILLKFRTMKEPVRGAGDDEARERITAFGQFLRSWSLDELPQLWNVLVGDMSLIGPRPLLLDYLPLYSPRQMRRHDVRPGLTGLAQVQGRNKVRWPRRFALDVWYVEHRGVGLDLIILLRTIRKLVHGVQHRSSGELAISPRFEGSALRIRPGGPSNRTVSERKPTAIHSHGANMSCNILISSAGRRLSLLRCFEESLQKLNVTGRVSIIDASRTAPAAHTGRDFWQVPCATLPAFRERLWQLVEEHEIRLIVPTVDPELPVLARLRSELELHGVHVAVSAPEAIAICGDKAETHTWLTANRFPTVQQWSLREALRQIHVLPFPVFVKPRFGSASRGVRNILTARELKAAADSPDELIVQTVALGEEYTVNCFVSQDGNCVCAVPHQRLEVRGGEVSKGVTARIPDLIDLVTRIAEHLPGAYGPLAVQCFREASGAIRIIEINPRFGGGYPLTYASGADYVSWLIRDAAGLPARYSSTWQSGLAMLRYDQEIFVRQSELTADVPA